MPLMGNSVKWVWHVILAATAATAIAAPSPSIAAELPVVRPSQELALLKAPHAAVSPSGRFSGKHGVIVAADHRRADRAARARPRHRRGRHRLAAGHAPRPPERSTGLDRAARNRAGDDELAHGRQDREPPPPRLPQRAPRTGLSAIVGKPSTPTPHGRFFVEESVRMPPGSAGGPFALALSAHSDALRTFEGGSGQVAIHGVANLERRRRDRELARLCAPRRSRHSLAGRAHRAGRARGDHPVSDFPDPESSRSCAGNPTHICPTAHSQH